MAGIPFDPDEISRAIEKEVVDIIREDAQAICRTVIFATPVGRPELWQSPPPRNYTPGHARRNWQINIGSPSGRELPGQDRIGTATLSNAISKLRAYRRLQPIYIENNVPYINRLNQGWSKQAPPRFVEKAIQVANVRSNTSVDRREI